MVLVQRLYHPILFQGPTVLFGTQPTDYYCTVNYGDIVELASAVE